MLKITDIKHKLVSLKLKKPVKVSFATITSIDTVLVKIETNDPSIYGFGEASPITFVTGTDEVITTHVIDILKPKLIGLSPFALNDIHNMMNVFITNNSTPKAGIDIALHDIMAKAAGVPLHVFLGGSTNTIESDITLGIDTVEETVKEAKTYIEQGFKQLKIKIGIDPIEDIKRIKAVRNAVGNGIKLRVDANQGYDFVTALKVIKEIEHLDIDVFEQPTKAFDLYGLKQVKAKSSIAIMADESAFTAQDSFTLLHGENVDLINIKLMKSNGLYGGVQMATVGIASNTRCMIGCMAETLIGNLASASLAAAYKNIITRVDIDSSLFFDYDGIKTNSKIGGGKITLSDEPGLGVHVDF